MRTLAGMLLRSGDRVRPALVVACTALVTALLLVALAMMLLPPQPSEMLFSVVAEAGTRGGAAFAAAILTVPLLLLLVQALRLGQAAREERLAGLRIAGATPRDVRRLSAYEVAVPAAIGAVLGIGLFWLLRLTIGGAPLDAPSAGSFARSGEPIGLVPTSVTPSWWMFLAVVVGVVALATGLGLRVGRGVLLTPHGVVRRRGGSAPRPWGLAVLVLAGVVGAVSVILGSPFDLAGVFAALALAVLALVMLAPWSAYTLGRLAQGRVTGVAALLASRRLVFEPGPAGRAGAAIGGIGLAFGVLGGVVGDVRGSGTGADFFYLFSILLVALCLLAALVVVSLSLAVHSAETLLDRRRSMASLHALGVPPETIRASQLWEGALVAVPMATLGAILGGAVSSLLTLGDLVSMATILVGIMLTPVLSLVAVWFAVALTGPVTRRVVDAEHLRTA